MKFFKKLENLLAATAFAEEGDFDTARQMATEPVPDARPATEGSGEMLPSGTSNRKSQRRRSRTSRSRAA